MRAAGARGDPASMQVIDERLDVSPVGIEFVLRPAGAQAEPDELVFDVIGRPSGFITNPLTSRHVHPAQSERYHVLAGAMRVELDGQVDVLRPGEHLTVPAGKPHRQLPAGSEPGHVRVTVKPAGRTEQYLRYLAQLAQDGQFNRLGLPRALSGAQMLLEFADVGYATFAPLALQRRAASALLRIWREYAFVDQWEVAAPPDAVYDVLVDAQTYPRWWRPVYIDVQTDGRPRVGGVSRQHFKGRLPYHLRTRSTLTRLEPAALIEADVDGDLRGRGVWTLTARPGGTNVRFDWTVHADRALLRILTPLLRPVLRANHSWAIARAIDGLEPYVKSNINRGAESMSQENEALVRRFFEEFCNQRRSEIATEIIAPDYVSHGPQAPPARGPEEVIARVGLYQEAVDGHWEVQELISAGDHVIARWTGSGTHRGELMGIDPTGKPINVDAISIFRIADGKIAEEWTVWDALGLLQQVGAVPAAA
jgi:predicted ester cyclase/mannose-6-phosphate isomerase-like protein (cupin superfamily)/uncharacterized protein YndB with AHSA1/START domain